MPTTAHFFTFAYLFFALALWPFWTPLSLFLIEHNKRPLFLGLVGYGAIAGVLLLLVPMLQGGPFTVSVVGRSLQYMEEYSLPYHLGLVAYLFATIGSAVLSSCIAMRFLAILFAIFALVSYFINQCAFISLWCFFSAIISVCIVGILFRETRLSI